MNKVKWLKLSLTAIKYIITLLLGALGGAEVSGDTVSNFINSL